MTEWVLMVYLCGGIIPRTKDCHWHMTGVYHDETSCVANGMVANLEETFPSFKCVQRKVFSSIPLPRPRPSSAGAAAPD